MDSGTVFWQEICWSLSLGTHPPVSIAASRFCDGCANDPHTHGEGADPTPSQPLACQHSSALELVRTQRSSRHHGGVTLLIVRLHYHPSLVSVHPRRIYTYCLLNSPCFQHFYTVKKYYPGWSEKLSPGQADVFANRKQFFKENIINMVSNKTL